MDVKEFILVALGAVIAVWGVTKLSMQARKKALVPLLSLIRGKVITSFWGGNVTIKGIWQGKIVEVKLGAAKGTRPFTITFYQQFPLPFHYSIGIVQKKWRYTRPTPTARIKILENELDDNFFETNDKKKIPNFLTPEYKNIIRSIFQKGFHFIEISEEYIKIGMVIIWDKNDTLSLGKRALKPKFVDETLKELLRFSG